MEQKKIDHRFVKNTKAFVECFVRDGNDLLLSERGGRGTLEKTLKEIILEMMECSDPYKVCDYFATDFSDDYDLLEHEEKNIPVLEYLNDAFIDIDVEHYGAPDMGSIVKSTLRQALEMLE